MYKRSRSAASSPSPTAKKARSASASPSPTAKRARSASASPSPTAKRMRSPKTRTAKESLEGFKMRSKYLVDTFKMYGAHLIEGHGKYPLYKRSDYHKGYVLKRPDKVPVQWGKAVVYLAEPGKCMWITTGRQLGARYFGSEKGIIDFLSGKAELEGVHHADISRKSFVPGDGYLDSTVSLRPLKTQPSFGFVWKLPIKFDRVESNKYLPRNIRPRQEDVLSLPRKTTWVSDIVRDGPPGVYIVSSCLDAGPIPSTYNWPEARVGWFPPAPKEHRKHAVRGVSVRKKILSAFRGGLFKKPSKPKALTAKATRNISTGGAPGGAFARFSHSPFPSNAGVNFNYTTQTRRVENRNRPKLRQKIKKTPVQEVLSRLQKNANTSLYSIKNLPANRSLMKNLRTTKIGLMFLRSNPAGFRAIAPRTVSLATRVPGMAATAIYKSISSNPTSNFATKLQRSPNTPETSPH